MTDFLKMDIFFVVTTVIVILLGVGLLVLLYYLIRILRSVDHVAENISEESDNIRSDVAVLREKVRSEGMKAKHLFEFFANVAKRNSRSTHKKAGE